MTGLNTNDKGIFLTYETSRSDIHFFDLRIKVVDGTVITTTYFKETDWNSYIDSKSCHHKSWLKLIPKSQFLRLRRNCTNHHDFVQDASILRGRFLEKGYDDNELEGAFRLALDKNRHDLLIPKSKNQDDSLNSSLSPPTQTSIMRLKKSCKGIGRY